MRVLLDACVPQDLRHSIAGHQVQTARYAGLSLLSNGALLSAMVGRFDVLVTVDANLPFQQTIGDKALAVVVLRADGITIEDLVTLIPALQNALPSIRPGEVRVVA